MCENNYSRCCGSLAACLLGLIITGAQIGWGPFAFIKYNKKPICLAEEKQKYTAEDIWLKNGRKNIFGTLYKAESGNKNQPIAILSHGYNGNSVYNKFIAEFLASSGISVYASAKAVKYAYDFISENIK